MENKPTVEELLRQQLELLAERSANEASVSDLPQLTLAMAEIYKLLAPNTEITESVRKVLQTHFTDSIQALSELSKDERIAYQIKEPVLDKTTGLFKSLPENDTSQSIERYKKLIQK